MKYVAAYSLMAMGGNEHPAVEEVAAFMKACGCNVDMAELEVFAKAFEGRKMADMVADGKEKMVKVEEARAAAAAVPEVVVEEPLVIVKEESVVEDTGPFMALFPSDDEEDY